MLRALLLLAHLSCAAQSVVPRAHIAPLLLPSREFVTCPTPGCGCYPLRADRVERHLRRCPKLLERSALKELGFWSPDANIGADELISSAPPGGKLLGGQREQELSRLIRRSHATTRSSVLAHTPAMSTRAQLTSRAGGKNEAERERHRAQRSAIVDQLLKMDLLGRGHCIVELGAGNGELALAMLEACPACEHDTIVLVDQFKPRGRKASGRQAADALLKERCAVFHRVKMRLEDVDLARLGEKLAPGRPLVVVSKHLCGAASDFALRAVGRASVSTAAPLLLAVLLGTCCHHRCEWRAYPNRPFLQDLSFDASDFALLCRMSSRGVDADISDDAAEVGRQIKDVLDEGRAAFLRRHGFAACLSTYVDASISPENVLVTARRSLKRHGEVPDSV